MNKLAKKIKVLLGMVKEEFEKAVLADGSEVSFDALEINREVYDAEGNPLPAGEYTLEDGTKVTVDENGVIKEIEKADGETEKEEVVEEMAEEEVKTETTETETETTETESTEPDKIAELESRVAALEQAQNDLYEMVLKLAENQRDNEEKVEETIQEFSKIKGEPQTAPLHFGSEKKEDEKLTAVDKFLALKHNK